MKIFLWSVSRKCIHQSILKRSETREVALSATPRCFNAVILAQNPWEGLSSKRNRPGRAKKKSLAHGAADIMRHPTFVGRQRCPTTDPLHGQHHQRRGVLENTAPHGTENSCCDRLPGRSNDSVLQKIDLNLWKLGIWCYPLSASNIQTMNGNIWQLYLHEVGNQWGSSQVTNIIILNNSDPASVTAAFTSALYFRISCSTSSKSHMGRVTCKPTPMSTAFWAFTGWSAKPGHITTGVPTLRDSMKLFWPPGRHDTCQYHSEEQQGHILWMGLLLIVFICLYCIQQPIVRRCQKWGFPVFEEKQQWDASPGSMGQEQIHARLQQVNLGHWWQTEGIFGQLQILQGICLWTQWDQQQRRIRRIGTQGLGLKMGRDHQFSKKPSQTTKTICKNLPRSPITNHVQTFLGPASKAPCQAAWQSSLPVKPFSWFSTFMRFAQPTWQGRGGIMIRMHLPVLCGFRGWCGCIRTWSLTAYASIRYIALSAPIYEIWCDLQIWYTVSISQIHIKLLYFVWSPPWHLYALLLSNLLAFYLTYLLVFDLAYLLALYLASLLAYVPADLLAYLLAYLLTSYLANLLAFYLANILALYLAYRHTFWHFIWHTCWHIFWHSIWHSIWHIFWHSIWYISWYFIWQIFWHSIWPLRSSGAHWAGRVPGWGPAVHTELGRSQVEVQRCTLSWAGPRLRSSSAHWAGKVPGWGPAVPTELGRSQVEVQRCPLSWEGPRLRSSGAHWARMLAKSLGKSWQGNSGCGSGGRGAGGDAGGGGAGGG